MPAKIQVGVIGLGKFGYQFGKTLVEEGLTVIGLDSDPLMVKNAKEVFSQVFEAEATNKQALVQLGFADLSHVLVSVGDSIAASSMISMYLKELDGPLVWVKATNNDHKKLLEKIGVDKVIIPEHLAAKQLANQLAIPGFIERLPFDHNMAIRELVVSKWADKSLREINLTNRYNAQVIAVKKAGSEQYTFVPKADNLLEAGDRLVVIGSYDQFNAFDP